MSIRMDGSKFWPLEQYCKLRLILILAIGIGTVVLSGCATESAMPMDNMNSTGPAATAVLEADQIMIDDLVFVLIQVLDPLSSTVQVGPTNDLLGREFTRVLGEEGYGIQRVGADQGANFVTYSRKLEPSVSGGSGVHLSLIIGDLELSRRYHLQDNNTVRPDSVFKLAGTRKKVAMDDGRFSSSDEVNPTIERVHYVAAEPILGGIPTISLITDTVVQRVVEAATAGPSYEALNSSKLEVSNLFYGGESTFGSVRDSYQRIGKDVVVFTNDSMRLGQVGKEQIAVFLNAFNETTDIINLVGCSNGPTNLGIGNEGLALGRAKRVTEEFISLGVARAKILDEGCWAPVSAGERYPGRAVVVELWRSKA